MHGEFKWPDRYWNLLIIFGDTLVAIASLSQLRHLRLQRTGARPCLYACNLYSRLRLERNRDRTAFGSQISYDFDVAYAGSP
jgi:hypothetical protein